MLMQEFLQCVMEKEGLRLKPIQPSLPIWSTLRSNSIHPNPSQLNPLQPISPDPPRNIHLFETVGICLHRQRMCIEVNSIETPVTGRAATLSSYIKAPSAPLPHPNQLRCAVYFASEGRKKWNDTEEHEDGLWEEEDIARCLNLLRCNSKLTQKVSKRVGWGWFMWGGALHVVSPDLTTSAICHHKSFSQPRLQKGQSWGFWGAFGTFQGTFGALQGTFRALGELLELLRDLPDHILLVTVS